MPSPNPAFAAPHLRRYDCDIVTPDGGFVRAFKSRGYYATAKEAAYGEATRLIAADGDDVGLVVRAYTRDGRYVECEVM